VPPDITHVSTPAVAPRRDIATRALVAGVRGYQLVISPVLHFLGGPGCGCRFTPTCSHYAIGALATHGPLRGATLAARRILRCHPWGPHGADPVPAPKSATAPTSPHAARAS
jgi:putative membrane protein insertion efficiency factor